MDRTIFTGYPLCMLLQGTELVERISKKKELGCKCVSFITVEEQKAERKAAVFWDLLGSKQKAKGMLEEVLFALIVYHLSVSSETLSVMLQLLVLTK